MSSTRTREIVPQSGAIGSALELLLAAAVAALMALLLISPLLAGTTTLADLGVTKATPNQVNLAQ